MFVNKPDIIILTETWLSDEIKNYELNLSDYSIYRCDRKNNRGSGTSIGGGVLVAISKSLKSSLIKLQSHQHNIECKSQSNDSPINIDEVYVKVKVGLDKYIVGAVYIPPYDTINSYYTHVSNLDYITSTLKDHKLIIGGDFNLPKINWHYDESLQCSKLNDCSPLKWQSALEICNLYSMHNLEQVFPDHPDKAYSLDLLFADPGSIKYIHSSDELVPPDKQHHICATFTLSGKILRSNYNHTVKYNYHEIDSEVLTHCLNQVDWNSLLDFDSLGLNGVVDMFYDMLHALVDLCIPKIGKYPKKFPYWFSDTLKNTIIEKKKWHKEWKNTKDEDKKIQFKIQFKKTRALCTKIMRYDYRQHINNIQHQAKHNLRGFWKFINMKRMDNSIPDEMHYNESKAQDEEKIVNMFAAHFMSVYKPSTLDYNSDLNKGNYITEQLEIKERHEVTYEEVTIAIKSLKTTHSCGPDSIPAVLIKKCAPVIAYPLSLIFSRSLYEGVFPNRWKISYVKPIYKNG